MIIKMLSQRFSVCVIIVCTFVLFESSLGHRNLVENSILLQEDPVVEAPVGTIVGSWEQTENGIPFRSFRGLKYASAIERFQQAVMVDKYEEELYEAQSNGAMCPQLNGDYTLPDNVDEDCLYLNVYAPEDVGEKLPVMVWIHGGSWQVGTGSNYGPNFYLDKNVIIVTINYRLGALGYLSLENNIMPGNMGYRDQNVALRWVKENIESFGGDSLDITVFGESAGSFSVIYQVLSPLSSGLFQKAIAQSGAPLAPMYKTERPGFHRNITVSYGRYFGCSTDSDDTLLECLSSKTMEEILYADVLCKDDFFCTGNPWGIAVIDTYSKAPFVKDTPENLLRSGQYNQVPIVMGINSEEGIFSAATFIWDETKFDEINEFWNFWGPVAIYDISSATEDQIEIASLVKEFYLKGKPASIETIHDVIDMYSDIVFWAGVHR